MIKNSMYAKKSRPRTHMSGGTKQWNKDKFRVLCVPLGGAVEWCEWAPTLDGEYSKGEGFAHQGENE